jgi:hypothetical protein
MEVDSFVEYRQLKQVLIDWNTPLINSIEVFNKSDTLKLCPQGYSDLFSKNWMGTVRSCDCIADTNTTGLSPLQVSFLIQVGNDPCPANCEEVPAFEA